MVRLNPCRGTLTIDGKLVEKDANFPDTPQVGDMEWNSDGRPTILQVERVEPYLENGERRFHVHARKK
jgi:hypothetical protein